MKSTMTPRVKCWSISIPRWPPFSSAPCMAKAAPWRAASRPPMVPARISCSTLRDCRIVWVRGTPPWLETETGRRDGRQFPISKMGREDDAGLAVSRKARKFSIPSTSVRPGRSLFRIEIEQVPRWGYSPPVPDRDCPRPRRRNARTSASDFSGKTSGYWHRVLRGLAGAGRSIGSRGACAADVQARQSAIRTPPARAPP